MSHDSGWCRTKSQFIGLTINQCTSTLQVKCTSCVSPIFIENKNKNFNHILSDNDIWYYLNKINNLEKLETQKKQALKSQIPIGKKRLSKDTN